jgi:hypothetical protein
MASALAAIRRLRFIAEAWYSFRTDKCGGKSSAGGIIEGLLVWTGLFSLILIAIYPIASFAIGAFWLVDRDWAATFVALGEAVFWFKRGNNTAPLDKWEKILRTRMKLRDTTYVPRTDEGSVRAVARLTGSRPSGAAMAKRLQLLDKLLYRAVSQQIDAVRSAPFDRELSRKWQEGLDRRLRFIVGLSIRSFARDWTRYTVSQLGLVASIALMLGVVAGLSWWVADAFVSEPEDASLSGDWTLATGGVVTFVTVATVAIVLTWRLVRALLDLFPAPTMIAGRAILVFAVVILISLSVSLSSEFPGVNPKEWMENNPTGSSVAGAAAILILFSTAAVWCLQYALRSSTGIKPASSRLLAASVALFFIIFLVAFAALSLETAIPRQLGDIFLVALLLMFAGLSSAALVYVHECFALWRRLGRSGFELSRLGFREWQVWVGFLLVTAPWVLQATQGPRAGTAELSAFSIAMIVVGLTGAFWTVVFGLLGAIFIVRVKWRHSVQLPDAQERIVSPDRMVHFALVRFPLGSYLQGRESHIVRHPDRSGLWEIGLPPPAAEDTTSAFGTDTKWIPEGTSSNPSSTDAKIDTRVSVAKSIGLSALVGVATGLGFLLMRGRR